MNSPKLEYSEMGKLQEVVRTLRHAGAVVNGSCGMHYGKKNVMLSYSWFLAVQHDLTITID